MKILYFLLGCAGVALGTAGAVLPVLPTVPFLLLAAFGFAKSSERLYQWFTNTQFYRKNLRSYAAGEGMTRTAKFRIITGVTLCMLFGFIVMICKELYIACGLLFGVWILHILYFGLKIKTKT